MQLTIPGEIAFRGKQNQPLFHLIVNAGVAMVVGRINYEHILQYSSTTRLH